MPFDAGATSMDPYVLQRAIEDFSVESDSRVDQQHDGQGRHTAITADSIGSQDGGASTLSLTSGIRMLYGPWLIDRDNVPTDDLTAVVRVDPALAAGTQNNWRPVGIESAMVVEIEATGAVTFTGLYAGTTQTRRILILVNRSSYTHSFAHNSGSSDSQNRFAFASSSTYEMPSGDVLWLYYDPGAPVWRGAGSSGMSQVRNAFVQVVTWVGSGGMGTDPQDFTFDTTLTDYAKAHCTPMVGAALTATARATSNTNLRLTGLPTASGDLTVVVNVVEYKNLG